MLKARTGCIVMRCARPCSGLRGGWRWGRREFVWVLGGICERVGQVTGKWLFAACAHGPIVPVGFATLTHEGVKHFDCLGGRC